MVSDTMTLTHTTRLGQNLLLLFTSYIDKTLKATILSYDAFIITLVKNDSLNGSNDPTIYIDSRVILLIEFNMTHLIHFNGY